MKKYDVVIVGGGIVGATTALALSKTTELSIAVIEATPFVLPDKRDPYALRVSALSLSSKHILQNLDCWEAIASKRIAPYQKMHVWDAGSQGKISFDANFFHRSALGFIVEDWITHSALIEKLKAKAEIDYLAPFNLKNVTRQAEGFLLVDDNAHQVQTTLLIAADGGNSSLRKQFNIILNQEDYGHSAIVATVKTELPHQNTAWQRFLPTGPLAFLPLNNLHHCSIVWSVNSAEAQALFQLKDRDFQSHLSSALEHKLGAIEWVSERKIFPLIKRQAKNYILPQFALVGDAAHTIHPLAGQGLNLGLLDAVSLADIITKQLIKNQNFASLKVLRRYERWRKSEADIMLKMIGFLKKIFTIENKPIKTLRGLGLNGCDQFSVIKRLLGNHALGVRDNIPFLARENY